jgi:hypothetical protein
MKSITPAKIEDWAHSEPKDWANESFAIAEQAQTKILHARGSVLRQASGESDDRSALCGRKRAPVVREQLQKAGVKFAHTLDAALSK